MSPCAAHMIDITDAKSNESHSQRLFNTITRKVFPSARERQIKDPQINQMVRSSIGQNLGTEVRKFRKRREIP
jgi:hypothetical protein